MMKIANDLRPILKEHKKSIIIALVASLIAGGFSSSIVGILNTALNNEHQNLIFYGAAFASVCVLGLLAGIWSEYLLISLGQSLALDLRMKLCRSILKTSVPNLHSIGRHRLYAVLTEDVESIANVCQLLPMLLINVALIVGCLAYLGWLSAALLIFIVATVSIIGGGLFVIQTAALSAFHRARDKVDVLFKHFRTLVEAIRELKIHSKRRDIFVKDCLQKTSQEIRDDLNRGMFSYTAAEQAGSFLFYAVIGVIVFIVPLTSAADPEVISGYTLGLLFLMGPIRTLLGTIPTLGEGVVAFNKIRALGFSLADYSEQETLLPLSAQRLERHRDYLTHGANTKNTNAAPVESLSFIGVEYCYKNPNQELFHPVGGEELSLDNQDDEPGFMLGPIDFDVSSGELVFITGGNGSGKSTLLMLLVGLFTAQKGMIKLNGNKITEDKLNAYRQLFSVVFSDPYIFDAVLGCESEKMEVASKMLAQLQLNKKVYMQGENFSTIELSQGQRKRLALLLAWLDDRPIYVFDEWAAEQDPVFKKYFYTEFLLMLKNKGKTVFVITHDDQYFSIADRILKLTDGKISDADLSWDFRAEGNEKRVAEMKRTKEI